MYRLPKLLLFALLVSLPFLFAFTLIFQVLPAQVEQAILWIVVALLGWLGPRGLEPVFKAIGAKGVGAVVLTYAIALVLGFVAYYAAVQFLGYTAPGDFYSVAFVILAASQIAFNRLKDSLNVATAAKYR
jgi:hypothetical protein